MEQMRTDDVQATQEDEQVMWGNNLTPEFLRKMQLKNLEILLYFQKFCQEHNLMFYLCGGTCIGAVRHSGFIPWDDDADVFMPRKDFEKLALIWNEEADPRYRYSRTTETHMTRMLFGMVHDMETTLVKTRTQDLDTLHGVRLDILPIDGCPKGKLAQWRQVYHALMYQLFILEEPFISKGKLAYWVTRAILATAKGHKGKFKRAKKYERLMSKYDLDTAYGARELCARWQYMRDIYPQQGFVTTLPAQFEGYTLPVPAGYDAYLTMAYGDWRSMPPKEKQVPLHETSLIDLERPFESYRGIAFPIPRPEDPRP